ncbi:transglutaminase domain-containing protein [Mycoplasma capricolum subsp. capricolum]|uniref:MAG6410 family transglutaminase-related lipoprotein n=1 Tax=Mycoplasma capricolum TaxID=2095 RepID=UPI003DA53822
MKKLQKYIKWLSLGSVVVLTSTTISCNVNTSSRNIFEIPTSNKRPKTPNSHSNSTNSSTPENSNTQPNNYENNNSSNNNSNQINNNEHSNNEIVTPPVENNTETNDTSINNQTYFSTISHIHHNLTELENKYIEFKNSEFQPIKIEEENIKNIILNSKLPVNFYSHPKFKLNSNHITLDQFLNNEYQFKLLDTFTNKEVSSEQIKWYQQISYPKDEIFDAGNNNDKNTFILSNDGTIKWKDTRDFNNDREVEEKSARIWASYNGYLYSAVVSVYSKEKSKIIDNETKARKMAKKIVEDNKWKELPALEKLIKAYEWMTKEVKYDYGNRTGDLLRSQNAYSALIERKTVCTGYAKGFKMIMDELGIPCKFIEGDSNREESFISKHAWNLVQIDNEWYHVDTTSDRVERNEIKTDFNFFLNTNNDFVDTDTFYREFPNQGSRLRNLKFKNFVENEEDVLTLIDNNYDVNKKQITKLELSTNKKLFRTITNAFSKRGLEVKDSKITSRRMPNQSVVYFFNKQNVENTEINVTNIKNYNNQNAIKIEFDKQIDDLRAGNFNISNAFIKKVEQQGNSYILHLEHFSNFDKIQIKLNSIKRKDYKFNLNGKDKVEFTIEKQEKPRVSIKSLDNRTIKIISETNNLEYNFNNNSWKDVPKNYIITDATIGNLYIRHKKTDTKPNSDIQVIEINKADEIDKLVKLINHNMLIGLDYSMEYKKEKETNWNTVKKTTLKDLDKGTYWIRAKAFDSTLASDISKVEIR